jgi:CRP/FNR family transcriptional regulator, cyclic AMP receptor protein
MIAAVVRILEVDPALADGLDDQTRALAAEHALARVETVAPGVWQSSLANERRGGDFGLLVLEGVIGRRLELEGGHSAFVELIGEGDVLCPWPEGSEAGSVRSHEQLLALTQTSVALLDRRFALAVARWPEITARLIDRAVQRSRSLAFLAAVAHLTRVELRLMAVLWHIADRWGRVTPEGVLIPLRLTNEILAGIVGARRPSVSTAMNVLARRRALSRRDDGRWVLQGDPPDRLADLMSLCGPSPRAGRRCAAESPAERLVVLRQGTGV